MASIKQMTRQFTINALERHLDELEKDTYRIISKTELTKAGLTENELAMIDENVLYHKRLADPSETLSPMGAKWWSRVLEIGRTSKVVKSPELVRKLQIEASYVLSDFEELSEADRYHFVDGDAHWQNELFSDKIKDGFPIYRHLLEYGETLTTIRNGAQKSMIQSAITRISKPVSVSSNMEISENARKIMKRLSMINHKND